MQQNGEILNIAAVLTNGPAAFLTGAGISTDSGIPDYRGAGTPPRKPMNITEFLNDPLFRKRFWAGAAVNFQTQQMFKANSGHLSVAKLEELGLSTGVMTQNVDGLHLMAGTKNLVELHGSGNRVLCIECGSRYTRGEIVSNFEKLNPGYVASQGSAMINPDGDAGVSDYADLTVPVCQNCGGILRPDIVYFGETVPSEVFAAAEKMVAESSSLIVAGSSLAVNTGIRLVQRAQKRELPIIVINRGATAIDKLATVRIEGGTTETLAALLTEVSN